MKEPFEFLEENTPNIACNCDDCGEPIFDRENYIDINMHYICENCANNRIREVSISDLSDEELDSYMAKGSNIITQCFGCNEDIIEGSLVFDIGNKEFLCEDCYKDCIKTAEATIGLDPDLEYESYRDNT